MAPYSTGPMSNDPRRSAKALRNQLRALDPDAIRRVRAVYHDLKAVSDADVQRHMGLQRCQHVIAQEVGFDSWAMMLANNGMNELEDAAIDQQVEEDHRQWDVIVGENSYHLMETDEFASAQAETNAYFDWIEVYDQDEPDIDAKGVVRIHVAWSASGEQDEDRMFSGDRITGEATLVVEPDGKPYWEDVHAEVVHELDEGDTSLPESIEPVGPDSPF